MHDSGIERQSGGTNCAYCQGDGRDEARTPREPGRHEHIRVHDFRTDESGNAPEKLFEGLK